ncbi:MAG: hypothetical protein JJU31_09100 [Wenzhouxiangella sp.]|nr:hypothetical protein [Wenzhouxiangella sp.]MCH8478702.1 hypothetical protein [Wenzhouxiangella sp.]
MFGLFGTSLDDVAKEIDRLMTEMATNYLNADLETVYRDAGSRYERAYHHGESIELIVASMRDFSIRVHHESFDEEGENTISFATGTNSAYQGLLLQVLTSGKRILQIQNNPMIRVTSGAKKLEKILKDRYAFSNPLEGLEGIY